MKVSPFGISKKYSFPTVPIILQSAEKNKLKISLKVVLITNN
jgi:hypothetical protein